MTQPRVALLSLPEPKPVPWDKRTWYGLVALAGVWACLFAATWGRWGYLSTDCGREMNVPAALAAGKTLYVDIWYTYTPLAPYLNAALFRIFGPRLEVLYWAGALAALSCAVLLYSSGLHLLSRVAAWIVGAAVLIQAFQSRLFNFPLAYSFGAVYAYVGACLTLWFLLNACTQASSAWIAMASLSSAGALLCKPEIGTGCFLALGILILCRTLKAPSAWRPAADVAAAMPGLIVCFAVASWMVSLRGADFITQENLMSWPTSYFMRHYGSGWLSSTGLGTRPELISNLIGVIYGGAIWVALRWVARRCEHRVLISWIVLILLPTGILIGARSFKVSELTRAAFFPPAALLVIAVFLPIAFWNWWVRRSAGSLKIVAALSLAVFIALRSLLSMDTDYAIYTNGPAILAVLFLLSSYLSRKADGFGYRGPLVELPGAGILAALIAIITPAYSVGRSWEPVRSERGVVYTDPGRAAPYRAAIEFIREKNRQGELVLSVPEDSHLYFLAGVSSPIRVYAFTPGVVAPGRMADEVIAEIEARKIKFLLWSNLKFPSYPDTTFGVDFDLELAQYLMTRYHPVSAIPPSQDRGWSAAVWERNAIPTP